MGVKAKQDKILVISSETTLAEIVEKAVGDSLQVLYASGQEEGLEKARKELPAIIALGYIEPHGSAFKLHRKLQEGWITKNIPLLMVDVNPQRKVLSIEEGMQIEADGYISLAGKDTQDSVTRLAEPISRLKERLAIRLRESANLFKEAVLNPDIFCVTWEQVPGRGAFEMQQEKLVEEAKRAARGNIVHAVSVTDNPGGNPAISTEILCTELKKLGIEPLVHIAFRDKNRNQCESLLYGVAALGVRNLLMLTGDYPSSGGFKGRAKPTFDMDSVHGLQLVEMMNKGMEHELMGRKLALAPTDFFAGASVSPFKQTEAELMGQYYKLGKKIEAGAKFLITQLGYDVRKYHELLTWLKVNGFDIPVLYNIYVLPYGAAKTMNANQIPGAVVTDKLLHELDMEKKAEDKGRAARLTRAAKTYAIAKGMGFAGAHIGGHGLTYEMLGSIIEEGETLAPKWEEFISEFDYPQPKGFYYFKKDTKTGLNTTEVAERTLKTKPPLIYWIGWLAHHALFNPHSPFFRMLLPVAVFIDRTGRPKRLFGWCEHMAKVAMFSCMNCGDCALFDIAYLCPMSQCPKNQRNGPCGGSYQGWCEIYPNEKKCIWVRAYERLRATREEDEIGARIVPPCNWELWETSSWLNFYCGRDHSAVRLGVKAPAREPFLLEVNRLLLRSIKRSFGRTGKA